MVTVKALMDFTDSQIREGSQEVKKGDELKMKAALATKYERIGYVKRVESTPAKSEGKK